MTVHHATFLALKLAAFVVIGFRFSWLVIEDRILMDARNWLIIKFRRKQWGEAELFIQCPWCIGFWIEVVMVLIAAFVMHVSLPLIALWPFAINAFTAPLHQLVDKYLN